MKNELIGAMYNHGANQGLLVLWSGLMGYIDKERTSHFFNIRLWDKGDIISEIKKNYEKFSDTFKSEIPLKRVWTLANNFL